DKWMYVFKNIGTLKEIPDFLKNDPIFEEVFATARIANLNAKEMRAYSLRQKRQWDEYSILTTARHEGKAEGKVEGRAEGIALGERRGIVKGIRQGVQQGIQQGASTRAMAIARALKDMKLPTQKIALATGLSI